MVSGLLLWGKVRMFTHCRGEDKGTVRTGTGGSATLAVAHVAQGQYSRLTPPVACFSEHQIPGPSTLGMSMKASAGLIFS